MKKIGSTVQKQFVWFDSLRPAAELNSSGAIVSQFVYGLKGNVPDYIIKGFVRYKVMTDHLGSVVAVVHSTNGTVAQRIEYDEFGRILSDTSPGFQPFGFAGGLYDPDTKLTLFGARSYDAEVGRWLSKDPILFAGGDTNLYGYVLSDPINKIDPPGTGPTAGAACFAILPIAAQTLPALAQQAAGSAFDRLTNGGSESSNGSSCKTSDNSSSNSIGRAATQTAAAAAARIAIQRYGPAACLALWLSPTF